MTSWPGRSWLVRALLARPRPDYALSSLLAGIVLCSGLSYAQVGSAYRISGVVLNEHDGAPVAGCHLTALRSGIGGTPRGAAVRGDGRRGDGDDGGPTTDSDASGHFTLVVPSAAGWQIYAYGPGFRRQAYNNHEGFFSAVVLTPAAPTYDLIFKVESDSSIAGFVRDEAGEAVRNARVSLSAPQSRSTDPAESGGSIRGATTTDDRGHYEFAGLAPGDYNVGVQAEPWYATSLRGRQPASVAGAAANPSLDVIYPEMWFPGAAEQRSAETLSLHHGESRQANFDLTPAPSTHLRISAPQPPAQLGLHGPMTPQVERVSPTGSPFLNTSVQVDAQGQIDVDGLSPGLYRVTLGGPNGPQAPAFVRVPSGAQRTVDLSAAIPVAEVTLRFDKDVDSSHIQTVLTDMETGATFTSFRRGDLQRRRNAVPTTATEGESKLDLPPGRYRVTLAGDNELYLSGLALNNKPVDGRIVTVASGSTTLTLKVAAGRATVRGIASASNKPLAGAMVMLVPASFGQPESITILRRDQTNTDGSFLIESVIPGDYILVAIDDGWTVNWRDPSTLERYLVRGVPVTLQANATAKQDLTAQSR